MTKEQAEKYLKSLRLSLASDAVDAILSALNAKAECLERYPESIADLIMLNALALLGLSHSPGGIQSEKAASGDARTFESGDGLYTQHYNALRLLDTYNCMGDLITRKNERANAGLWVACGGCL